MMQKSNERWFRLFVIVLGILVSFVSAAAGYVYSNLEEKVTAIEIKFEDHRMTQFQDELITAERLKAIEVILEEIRDELRGRE